MDVICPYCSDVHDIEALEPSFRKPEAFLRIPVAQRDFRVMDSKDAVAIRNIGDTERRYFLRVLAPFNVSGLPSPISWGIWVEVTERQWNRVNELWDAPDQNNEPPFVAKIANILPGYVNSESIIGMVALTDANNIPTFHATAPRDHPFVREQTAGVTPERAAEWMILIYHPESLIQERINDRITEGRVPAPEQAPTEKLWWQFWRR